MNIVIITEFYPATHRQTAGAFTRQFVGSLARHQHNCVVINPVSLLHRKFGNLPNRFLIDRFDEQTSASVYHPRYISLSSQDLGFTHTGRWTNALFVRSALKSFLDLPISPDIVYGHFLYPAGYAAVCAAKQIGIPSVVGVGEGEFWTLEAEGDKRASTHMRSATAFMALSSVIARELNTRLHIPVEKICVSPNGVDLALFQPESDRHACCAKLGLPADTFKISFIGPPITQKGYPHLRHAVAGMQGVQLILMGRGMVASSDPEVAFSGMVPHADVPHYLGASDIFVLPTAVEGSCNSVIEAMACGLPIITSEGEYMDDIVDDNVAIRVNPSDTEAIRKAILTLKDAPELRRKMSEACIQKAKQFDINTRTSRFIQWVRCLRKDCQA